MTATLTTTRRRFTELARTQGRVDAQAGIIYGVKLLGRHSRNSREYSERAMQNAVSLYDGKKVYLNHPESAKLNEDRRWEDWVGVLHNPRYQAGGIYADVHLRTKAPRYEELIEAAEKFHGCFGMSHVADGDSRMQGGDEIIESITEVFSVDIVTDPATTAGFFESSTMLPTTAGEQLANALDELRLISCPDDLIEKFTTLGEMLTAMAKGAEQAEPVHESYSAPWISHSPLYYKVMESSDETLTAAAFARRYRSF